MFPYFRLSNLIMVYLLGVMITAASCGEARLIPSSLWSVLAFRFRFPSLPVFPSRWKRPRILSPVFIATFPVALVISHLADRLRQQAQVARHEVSGRHRYAWSQSPARRHQEGTGEIFQK